jgi:hypothetical protein
MFGWHLQHQVDIVRDCHELGKGRSPENDVVGALKVRDDEADEFNAEMLGSAELDGERDLSQGLRGLPLEYSLERCVVWLEILFL